MVYISGVIRRMGSVFDDMAMTFNTSGVKLKRETTSNSKWYWHLIAKASMFFVLRRFGCARSWTSAVIASSKQSTFAGDLESVSWASSAPRRLRLSSCSPCMSRAWTDAPTLGLTSPAPRQFRPRRAGGGPAGVVRPRPSALSARWGPPPLAPRSCTARPLACTQLAARLSATPPLSPSVAFVLVASPMSKFNTFRGHRLSFSVFERLRIFGGVCCFE